MSGAKQSVMALLAKADSSLKVISSVICPLTQKTMYDGKIDAIYVSLVEQQANILFDGIYLKSFKRYQCEVICENSTGDVDGETMIQHVDNIINYFSLHCEYGRYFTVIYKGASIVDDAFVYRAVIEICEQIV